MTSRRPVVVAADEFPASARQAGPQSPLVQELRGDYVVMVLYLGDEYDILRPQVAAPLRVSDHVDGFVALRTKIAVSRGY